MGRITFDKDILAGKPVIKGTRISVEVILSLLSSDVPVDEILKEYPQLKREDVLAAIEYAAESLKNEEIIFTGRSKSQNSSGTGQRRKKSYSHP